MLVAHFGVSMGKRRKNQAVLPEKRVPKPKKPFSPSSPPEEIVTGKRHERQEKRSVNNYVLTTKNLLTSSRLVNEIQILRDSSNAPTSSPHSYISVELPLPCPLQD